MNFLASYCSVVFLGLANVGRAQNPNNVSHGELPFAVINSTIIADLSHVALDVHEIKTIEVFNGYDNPPLLQGLAPGGVIAIAYNKPVNSKALTTISSEFGQCGPVNFVLNGHPLNDEQAAKLRIVPTSIAQIRILRAASQQRLVQADSKSYEELPATISIDLDNTAPFIEHEPGAVRIR